MPTTPMRPCAEPGCPRLVRRGRCPAHDYKRQRDRARGSSTQQGYGAPWRKARAAFLRANALCVACASTGRTTAATVVDHIRPHRGDQALFWDRANWQALCKHHHDSKTGRESGWGEGAGQKLSTISTGSVAPPARTRGQIRVEGDLR